MRTVERAIAVAVLTFVMGTGAALAWDVHGSVVCGGTTLGVPGVNVTIGYAGHPDFTSYSGVTDASGIFDIVVPDALTNADVTLVLDSFTTIFQSIPIVIGVPIGPFSIPIDVCGGPPPPPPGLGSAGITGDCAGFTVSVSGTLCGSGSVDFVVNLMPAAGGSFAIPGSIAVTGDASCSFSASASGAWPAGANAAGATMNGSATLSGSTICFPPDATTGSFTCGPAGVPLFDVPVSCAPPSGKTGAIGPSSMEGAIKISNGDWVNGGYSMKSTVTGALTIAANVTITGPCSNGGTDTVTIPLATLTYLNPSIATDWLPTGDANNVLSWQGSVRVGVTSPPICGGVGKLDASKGAVFTFTASASPPQPGATVTFRFKYRDPAAKGKPNTNCLDTSDPNRARADVCGASWSATKTFDP
jgi:hypothetical protein